MSATAIAGAASARGGSLRRFASQEALLAVAVIGLAVVVGFINPRFLATRNLADLLLGNAYIAVAAVGMSMVIISGNIDISVGALIGVLATISGSLAVAGAPIVVAWLAPLVLGVAVMAAQGAVVAYLRIPAIVVTLGMMSILKGGLISVTGGEWITDLPHGFHLADLSVLGVPMPVVIMVLATVLAALWMHYSPRGRAIYATGGNAEAARLCGVNPQRTVVMVFALHGLFAGIADARLCDPASRHPVDHAGRPGAHRHHRLGGRRGQHSRRRRHGSRLDAGGDPHRRDHQRARFHQRLALLDRRRARRPDPRHRDRRHPAPPAARRAGMEEMSVAAETPAHRTPWWLKRHETLLAIILAIALVGLGAFNERFLTLDNLLNQGRLMTEIGLIALPMTFVIVTGGIDLSVGAVVGLCAIMLGFSWKAFGFPLPLAIVFALFVGGLAGLVNGLVITRLKVPPLIMTIATLALYRGLAEGISQARSVRGYPEWFYFLGQGSLFGVPTQLLILIVLIVVAGVALDRTTFGRTLYAIGSNETAARFSALNVDRAKLVVYTLSGFASGLAAFVLVSRVTTTRSDMGLGYELDVIAAVVLGGTSIFGGSGTIWGTAIGLAMIQLLKNGLALTGVKGDATIVVIGVALILSVLVASSARTMARVFETLSTRNLKLETRNFNRSLCQLHPHA